MNFGGTRGRGDNNSDYNDDSNGDSHGHGDGIKILDTFLAICNRAVELRLDDVALSVPKRKVGG